MAVPAAAFTIYAFLCFFQCCGFGSAMDATTALSFGITGMGLRPADMAAPLNYTAGIAFLLCGIGGFIVVANSLNAGVATIPSGPALFPAREK
ncbi:MAG: hypothetical protein ACOX1O_02670 [Eggerthellaceae bacterium]|jgi:hypothetical protein